MLEVQASFERIMSDDLDEHNGKITIGGRILTILLFSDGIDTQVLTKLAQALQLELRVNLEDQMMTNSAYGNLRDKGG